MACTHPSHATCTHPPHLAPTPCTHPPLPLTFQDNYISPGQWKITVNLVPGLQKIYGWVKDAAGNIGSSNTEVKFDASPPSGDKYSLVLDEGKATTYYRWVHVNFTPKFVDDLWDICIGTDPYKSNCTDCNPIGSYTSRGCVREGSAVQFKLLANISAGTKVTLYAW